MSAPDFEKEAREMVDSTADLDPQDEDYWVSVRAAQGLLERAYEAGARDEREACAKELWTKVRTTAKGLEIVRKCMDAIRARGGSNG